MNGCLSASILVACHTIQQLACCRCAETTVTDVAKPLSASSLQTAGVEGEDHGAALNIKLMEPLAQGASRFEKLLPPPKNPLAPNFFKRRKSE